MVLPRGFKAESSRIAGEVRKEIGLSTNDRLDLRMLSMQWGIEVISMSDLPCGAETLTHFMQSRMKKLSGFLVPTSEGRAIVYNSTHEKPRIRSTLAHELAHVILEHEFELLMGDDDGCQFGTGTQEEEANWFAGELLVPQKAARNAVFDGLSVDALSVKFEVSVQMARWRMNVSGGHQMLRRSRQRSGGVG